MGELVDLISTIGFAEGRKSGDVLGYEEQESHRQ